MQGVIPRDLQKLEFSNAGPSNFNQALPVAKQIPVEERSYAARLKCANATEDTNRFLKHEQYSPQRKCIQEEGGYRCNLSGANVDSEKIKKSVRAALFHSLRMDRVSADITYLYQGMAEVVQVKSALVMRCVQDQETGKVEMRIFYDQRDKNNEALQEVIEEQALLNQSIRDVRENVSEPYVVIGSGVALQTSAAPPNSPNNREEKNESEWRESSMGCIEGDIKSALEKMIPPGAFGREDKIQRFSRTVAEEYKNLKNEELQLFYAFGRNASTREVEVKLAEEGNVLKTIKSNSLWASKL